MKLEESTGSLQIPLDFVMLEEKFSRSPNMVIGTVPTGLGAVILHFEMI